ncbi:hypothetical protein [Alistipes putredinis]|uniref:hypothetical protein n=1 Tax=Alistipes putredinis TaxID=28117 RepID=UPI003AEF7A1D
MKTPDEIKKALKYHKDLDSCFDCPYDCFDSYCSVGLTADVLAYIEQLESRAEPKNRVLTLEEVDAHCEGGADAAPLWVEFDGGINGWVLIAPVRETCKMDFVSKYLAMMGILYEKEWRCWLRKPTEAERRETPWEGDSHE